MFRYHKLDHIKEFIQRLNDLPLETTDYEEVKTGIRTLFKDGRIVVPAMNLNLKQKLYRGVVYKEKPMSVDKLGAPKNINVNNFQRCNSPGNAMFYCAGGVNVVFHELRPRVGDKIYVSKWVVDKSDFFLARIPNPDYEGFCKASSAMHSFFDDKFLEQNLDDSPDKYKITAAISDFTLNEKLFDSKILGIIYNSTAYKGKASNLAISPQAVDESMSLVSVEEWVVKGVSEAGYSAEPTDFASCFTNGNIKWVGRQKQWVIPPMTKAKFVMGRDGWIATDENGSEIFPS